MRDLDDPENPYRGRYEAWDLWTFERIRGTSREDVVAWYQGTAPEDYMLLTIRVDKQGFVVPLRLSTTDDLAARHDPNYTAEADCRFSLRGGGEMGQRVRDAYEEMLVGLHMPYAPAIPGWLAAAPPLQVLLMPDGDIVTSGDPDPERTINHRPQGNVPAATAELVFRRYDASGNLLAESEPGAPWFTVYFEDFNTIREKYEAEDATYWEYGGYVVFNDPKTRSIKAVFDYDGTELPVGGQINWYENRFETVQGAYLPILHRMQNGD